MYDAIVVGAGPCGNMAALELARRGMSVAVLDSRTRIGDKLCTGIIGRECAELFPPAEGQIHREARSATVVSPRGRRYRFERGTAQAHIVDRVAYVNSVAETAQNSGAEYILDARVSDIRIADAHAELGTRTGDAYRCRMVIVASGFGTPLLRMVGLNGGSDNEYLIGCQVEAEAADLTETEVYLGSETAHQSFAWLVPLTGTRALVGMAPRRRVDGQMDEFVGRLQSEGRINGTIGRPQTWGIPIRPLSPSYADRTLVAGDAAGLVKPTTGGGIYYAFLSGRIAAEAALSAIESGKYAANDLRRYEQQWKAMFGRELRIGYYARLLYESLSDEQVERLMDEFLSDGEIADYIGEDVGFDWHSRAIMNALRHASIRRVLTTLGPAAAPFVARLLHARG